MVFFIFYKFIYFIIYKIIYTYTYYTLLLNKINYLVSQAALSTLYHVEFLGTRSLKMKCSVCKCGHVHHNIFSRLYLEYNFMTISYTFITYKFFINYILSEKTVLVPQMDLIYHPFSILDIILCDIHGMQSVDHIIKSDNY